ncbi:MAG: hypothetical protein ACYTEY_18630 [Planctomycetota bacterium]|jgi:hypothetical protein
MQEESPNRTRLIAFVLICLTLVGGWFFLSRSGARAAVDETVGVFVPGPQEMERRMDAVDEARRLTDQINLRQLQALDELE